MQGRGSFMGGVGGGLFFEFAQSYQAERKVEQRVEQTRF